MHKMYRYLLYILFSLLGISVQAQQLRFDKLTVEDGLSNPRVVSIFQDSRGFIWFTTADGLNKYDGYNFTVYRHDIRDSNSIGDNSINSITEDETGIIWIGTGRGGLSKYDREKNNFTNYVNDPENPKSITNNWVKSLLIDSYGEIWVGTIGGGLDRFDLKSGEFIHYINDPENSKSLGDNFVWSLFEDQDSILWIGTQRGGLSKFNRETEEFTNYLEEPATSKSSTINWVTSIRNYNHDELILGTFNDGIKIFNKKNGNFLHYNHHPENPKSLIGNQVRSLLADGSGHIWIGTSEGLSIYNKGKNNFSNYKSELTNPNSLIDNKVFSLTEDRSGVIWVGTSGGINIFRKPKVDVVNYTFDSENPASISSNQVASIYEDISGVIWVGTADGGLNSFDGNKFTRFKHNPSNPSSISNGLIFQIFEDRSGLLWIGTTTGLNKYNPETGKFAKLDIRNPNDPGNTGSFLISSICQDKSGLLWFGTSLGLVSYNKETETLNFYNHEKDNPNSLPGNLIYSVLEDQFGSLWVGTTEGLSKYLESNHSFITYSHHSDDPNSLSHNDIRTIFEDTDGHLWIATYGGGLNKFDRENESFEYYGEKDGLLNDKTWGIIEDDDKNLWIKTVSGFSKFNLRNEKFTDFTKDNGFYSFTFSSDAFTRTRDGRILYGGTDGLFMFHPDSINENKYPPPVVLTDFRIHNKTVPIRKNVNDENIFSLPVHITELDEIALNYQQDFFTFEFAALDYTNPLLNQYFYKMEGFNNDWIKTDAKNRTASFTNLDAGKYTFRVKGSNNDGIWNEKGASVKVIITPPPWQTWWAYTLYFVFISGLIVGFIYIKTTQLRKRQEELEEMVQQRTEQIEIHKKSLEEKNHELNLIQFGINNAKDSICFVDPVTAEILDSNVNAYKSLGYKKEDIVGKKFWYYDINFLPENWPEFVEKLKNGEKLYYESFQYTIDDEKTPIDVNASYFQFEGNNYIVAFTHDITERKLAEEELVVKEKLMSSLAAAVSELIVKPDLNQGMMKSLEIMGSGTGHERGYIFQNQMDDDGIASMNQKYEWFSESVTSEIENPDLQDLPYEGTFKEMFKRLKSRTHFYAETSSFDEINRKMLEERKILSIIIFPIFVLDEFWGFVGFDSCSRVREYSDIELSSFSAFTEAMGEAITKNVVSEELREKLDELETFNNLVIGRELVMIELKKEINKLLVSIGEKEKYEIVDDNEFSEEIKKNIDNL